MIKTVIIHAHQQEREKIESILSGEEEFKIVAQGKDGYDALRLTGSLKPDIALIDTRLDFIEGEELPPLLRARSPLTAVVILAAGISDFQLYRAASNKVSGFLSTEMEMDMLPGILKYISDGESFISPALAARFLHIISAINGKGIDAHSIFAKKPGEKVLHKDSLPLSLRSAGKEKQGVLSMKDPTSYLSKMELQILTLIGEGFSSNEIAERLDLAVGTIRNYISVIMRKTGLRNRLEMVRYSFNFGLVSLLPA